jgi:excisionase family DNA binding protein
MDPYDIAVEILKGVAPDATATRLRHLLGGSLPREDRLLSPRDAAARLGVSVRTIATMIEEKQLPCIEIRPGHDVWRHGRLISIGGRVGIPESAIEDYIAAHKR